MLLNVWFINLHTVISIIEYTVNIGVFNVDTVKSFIFAGHNFRGFMIMGTFVGT